MKEIEKKERMGLDPITRKIEQERVVLQNCPWKGWVACIVRSLAFLQWVNW